MSPAGEKGVLFVKNENLLGAVAGLLLGLAVLDLLRIEAE